MEINWGEILTAVLLAVLPPLAAAGAYWLVALGRAEWERFKLMKPDVATFIERAAKVAVQAAEQAGAGKIISDKKDYALEVARTWLLEHGLQVDVLLVEAEIERQVWKLFNDPDKDKALPG